MFTLLYSSCFTSGQGPGGTLAGLWGSGCGCWERKRPSGSGEVRGGVVLQCLEAEAEYTGGTDCLVGDGGKAAGLLTGLG